MREIKFSFMWKHSKTGGFIERIYTLEGIMGGDHYDEMSDNALLRPYVLHAKRMYTGLKDKEGREIYEGDIVEAYHHEHEETETGVVCFGEGTFQLKNNHGHMRYWSDGCHDWYSMEQYESFELKIVGNIYEQPELLEK